MTVDESADSRMEIQCPLKLLNMNIKLHQLRQRQAQGVQGAQQQPGAGGPSKQEKVPRPTLNRNISEDKYIHFHRLWQRYKRSLRMTSEMMIRDQLLSCCSDELSEELGNLFGEQLVNKTEEELLVRCGGLLWWPRTI